MRRMRHASLLLLVLVGCTSGPAPAKTDTAPAGADAPDAGEPAKADAGPEKHPPTGNYEITTRIVSDTCTPAYVAPEPWRGFVQSAAEKDVAKLNIGLMAVPPSSDTRLSARSDFRLRMSEPVRHTFSPPDCAGYTAERSFEISDANKDGFKLTITVTHGDPGTCAPTFPSNCMTKVEQSFRAVEPMCRAECTRGARLTDPTVADLSAQTWTVDCKCD